MNTESRILVATDSPSDATLIGNLLGDEFKDVAISADPRRAVAAFDEHRPHVLVLAFSPLTKAENFYLGIQREHPLTRDHSYRTVILCSREETQRAFELCKQGCFDNYVVFWPLTYDAPRLHMSVHQALRDLENVSGRSSMDREWSAHARKLAPLESRLEQYSTRGSNFVGLASQSLSQAEKGIDAALERLCSKLSTYDRQSPVDTRDHTGIQLALNRIKLEEVGKQFKAVAAAMEPMRTWAGSIKEAVEPQLQSVRALQSMAEQVAPLVMVVDEDKHQQKLLRTLLAETEMELVFVGSSVDAEGALSRHRPDLVLIDINLTDIDGIELTRRLKSVESFAGIPVIMISRVGDKDRVFQSQRAGASDFVLKPFEKEILVAKLNRYLAEARPS